MVNPITIKEINYAEAFYKCYRQGTYHTWVVSNNFRELANRFAKNKTQDEYFCFVKTKLKVFNIADVKIDKGSDFIVFRHYFRSIPYRVLQYGSHHIIFCTSSVYKRSTLDGNNMVFIEDVR